MSPESGKRISLAISTGSLYPSDPRKPWEAIIPRLATEAIAKHAIEFKDVVDRMTPEPLRDMVEVGISLHWSDRINAKQLMHRLDAEGIPVTSHDIPDIESVSMLGAKIKQALTSNSQEGLEEILLHGGWYLINTRSEHSRIRRLHEAMSATRESQVSPVIFRTSLASFLQNCDASLFRILKSYTISKNIAVALEIDADKYTPSDYMEAIRKLNAETYHGIPVFADLDVGHLAQSRALHPDHEIPEVNSLFRSIMADDGRLVGTVSLNQYAGGGGTHVWLGDPNGQVILSKIGSSMAEYREKLPFGPVAILEINPKHTHHLLRHFPHIINNFLEHFA